MILSVLGLVVFAGCGSKEAKFVDALCACDTENEDDYEGMSDCYDKLQEEYDIAAFDVDALATAMVESECNDEEDEMTEDDAKEFAEFLIEAAKEEAEEGEE